MLSGVSEQAPELVVPRVLSPIHSKAGEEVSHELEDVPIPYDGVEERSRSVSGMTFTKTGSPRDYGSGSSVAVAFVRPRLLPQVVVEELDGLLAEEVVPDLLVVGEVGFAAKIVVVAFDGDESRGGSGLFQGAVQSLALVEGHGVVAGAVHDEERCCLDVVDLGGEGGLPAESYGDGSGEETRGEEPDAQVMGAIAARFSSVQPGPVTRITVGNGLSGSG